MNTYVNVLSTTCQSHRHQWPHERSRFFPAHEWGWKSRTRGEAECWVVFSITRAREKCDFLSWGPAKCSYFHGGKTTSLFDREIRLEKFILFDFETWKIDKQKNSIMFNNFWAGFLGAFFQFQEFLGLLEWTLPAWAPHHQTRNHRSNLLNWRLANQL